jgi:hypothetical protein
MESYSDNTLSIKNKKQKTPKYSRMRKGLLNRTTKTKQTRNQIKPQWEEIGKPRPKRKGKTKPTKGKKEERKRKKIKKLRTKPQSTQIIQGHISGGT